MKDDRGSIAFQAVRMPSSGTRFSVSGGLTLNGALAMNGGNSTMTLDGGAQSFYSGTLAFGTAASGTKNVAIASGTMWTIASPADVQGGTGRINGSGAVVNQGRVSANVSGKLIELRAATMTNEGVVETLNGGLASIGASGTTFTNAAAGVLNVSTGTLTLNSAWSNAGTISAAGGTVVMNGTWNNAGLIRGTNGAVLQFGGTIRTSDIGRVERSASTRRIAGTLDNHSSAPTMDVASGPCQFAGAQISGGTVESVGGDRTIGVTYTPAGGGTTTLDDVTVHGNLNITGTNETVVQLRTTAQVNGQVTIGPRGYFWVDTPRVLASTPIHFGASYATDANFAAIGDAPPTLGPEMLIDGTAGRITGPVGTPVINHGVIRAGAGSNIDVSAALTNAGRGEALDGGKLTLGDEFSEYDRIWTNLPEGVLSATHGATLSCFDGGENRGTITSGVSTLTIGERSVPWTNTGMIHAVDSTVQFYGRWSNTGTISVTNSTLYLGGRFTTADLGDLQLSGVSTSRAPRR